MSLESETNGFSCFLLFRHPLVSQNMVAVKNHYYFGRMPTTYTKSGYSMNCIVSQ